MQSSVKYAIDFGTSNSLLCVVTGDQVSDPLPLDPNAENPSVMRTVLFYPSAKEVFFGSDAVREFRSNDLEGRLIRSVKRFLPSKTFSGTQIGGKKLSLEELISTFILEMRLRANQIVGKDVTSVVLGRPALFSEDPDLDQLAEKRLRSAAERAGFKEIEFLPEPLAAAFRYRLELKKEALILVADFGGGTSDYTVLRVGKRDFKPSDVLAIGGVPLAGDSLDGEIMRHRVSRHFGSQVEYRTPFGANVLKMPKVLMENLCSTAYLPLLSRRENSDFLDQIKKASIGPDDKRVMTQLETLISDQLGFPIFEAIEAGKRGLSDQPQSVISFEYPGIHVSEPLTQNDFEEISQSTVDRIIKALDQTLEKAGVTPDQIDRVCATGGTARAKVLRDPIIERFGLAKIEEYRNYTSIVEGLGQWAAQRSNVR